MDSRIVHNRCHICIGCGRCTDTKGMNVIVQNGIEQEIVPIPSKDGRRLVAVDIGTTTIAMQLYDKGGRVQDSFAVVNPQTKYGADVLSRIQAAEEPEPKMELQKMVQDVLAQGFSRFQRQLPANESLFAVIAANTTMVYLLMGYDTEELGRAPFRASHLEGISAQISGVPCAIFPGLSAFVGGDIVAGIYACGMAGSKEPILLIDLGTNGEMVLGSKGKILACATAAGPAFEGGANKGIWGADMVSLLARMKREGVMDETGLLADAYFESGVRIADVCVSQKSIRQIQLAKGAIAAGIQILAKECRMELSEISRVILAGGFGYYLNPKDAVQIGLLPEALAGETRSGGNTALTGALKLGRKILSGEWDEGSFGGLGGADFLKCSAKILNLAAHPDFEEIYLRSMELQPQ